MYSRFKDKICKIEDGAFENAAILIVVLMYFMIIRETVLRYMDGEVYPIMWRMQPYYLYVGYLAVGFAVFFIISRCMKMNRIEILLYLREHIWDFALLLFLVLAVVSTSQAKYIKISYEGYVTRFSGLRTFFIYAGIYICGRTIKTKRNVLYWIFIVTSTFQGTLILTKDIGYFGLYEGAFFNTNHTGYFMCMGIMSAEVLMIQKDLRKGIRCLAALLLGYNLWLLIINNTFGAYLAVFVGMIFMCMIGLLNKQISGKATFAAVIIFLIVSVLGEIHTGNVMENFNITIGDINKIGDGDESVGSVGTGRGELWINCMKSISERPLLGCGPELLWYVGDDEPHNEVMQLCAEEGVPAGMLYLFAVLMLFVSKIKTIRKETKGIVCSAGIVTAYFVSSMFGVIFFYTATFYFLFLGNVSVDE